MARKIKTEEVEVQIPQEMLKPKIQPLMHEFGNGDMNILRDKINEIING